MRGCARAGIAPHGGLRPAMRVTSEIVATREVATGEPVGYGGRFVAARPTRVGLVAFGYADGYPRSAPHGTPVAVGGRMAPLIGRLSMDMLTVDVTDLPTASLGTEVELWGPKVPVDGVAARAGTIAYELLCNAKRAPMRYVGTPSPLEIAPEPSPCVHSAPGKLPLPGRCSHSC
jgi:alanine racemase